MQKQLFLHVGLPKTGTTALQSWFSEHISALDASGIHYPDMFGRDFGKHSFIVRELRQNPDLPELTPLFETLERSALLLSNEGMTNHLHDFHPDAMKAFREKTADFETTILILDRNPSAWLSSYYKQCVVTPNNGACELWGTDLTLDQITHTPRVQRLLDINQTIADGVAAFGAQHVAHFHFEDPDWFGKVKDLLGLQDRDTGPLPRVNAAIPDWSIEILRRINCLEPKMLVRTTWKALLQGFLNSNHEILILAAQDERKPPISSVDLTILDQAFGVIDTPYAFEAIEADQAQAFRSFVHDRVS